MVLCQPAIDVDTMVLRNWMARGPSRAVTRECRTWSSTTQALHMMFETALRMATGAAYDTRGVFLKPRCCHRHCTQVGDKS